MQRRDFIKGAATCAAGLAAGVNLFAQQIGEIGAANLTDGVDLSGAKNLGEKFAAMTPYLTLNNRILMPIIGLSAAKFDGLKDKNALGDGSWARLPPDRYGRGRGGRSCCICG
ncbi:twin-arginine translocation signal domain-containing protein [uncultured Campylobacter sp.]|uniref:twin-arginine translocation signal domain-containing protein n=1 Tax=uncultured Campylobacter sp. TaxID=218934 RepID=UPI00262F8928|nr:twin-arginine translocation signal domain-containing protein [uncultured Campylobacter sp.]